MAPLRQDDVILLAEQEGIENIEGFLKSVREAYATPFAANPLTLKFLLKQYLTSHDLPKRRVVLFEKGCLELTKEWSKTRREENTAGELTGVEWLAIASRLAAVTLFGGKAAFSLHFEPDEVAAEEIGAVSVEGGNEVVGLVFDDSPDSTKQKTVEVGRDQVEEVLGSALFSSAGRTL